MRRNTSSVLASSPTMVGAVTVLVAIVAVFLAYNANQGLPFVPVYSVSVEVPNAARVTDANEVRIGGTRVGVIESIEPIIDDSSTQSVSVDSDETELPTVSARIQLKLDESARPLPQDSIFRIRYRSAFGLKYIEIVRGTGPDAPDGFIFNGLDDGVTCALPVASGGQFKEEPDEAGSNGCFQSQNEFDELNNTFNRETRLAQRDNLEGFGNAFASRGVSLNDSIQQLEPLFQVAGPVGRALVDEDTRLVRLFPALARTAKLVQPVASLQAEQFAFAARTFEAISRVPEAYAQVIEQGPETLRTAIDLLPAQREFVSNSADLALELNPGIANLRKALPDLNEAVKVGAPVLETSPPVNRRLRDALRELKQLVEQPSTRTTLMRLAETFDEATPLVRYVAPAQTVCNYWNYWFTYFPNALSDVEPLLGNAFRQTLTRFPAARQVETPLGGYSGVGANGKSGPADMGDDGVFKPYQNPIVNTRVYAPTGQRNADCQNGQNGYALGRLPVPGQIPADPATRVSDFPGTRGPTTVFYNADGERVLEDTRIRSRRPGTWKGNRR
ncbi:MAG: MlaD family protein [Actinomycetota bacterium]|nr:MlaD family protein [Actinomycetota bacterium]